jgi:hypothetical protein
MIKKIKIFFALRFEMGKFLILHIPACQVALTLSHSLSEKENFSFLFILFFAVEHMPSSMQKFQVGGEFRRLKPLFVGAQEIGRDFFNKILQK